MYVSQERGLILILEKMVKLVDLMRGG